MSIFSKRIHRCAGGPDGKSIKEQKLKLPHTTEPNVADGIDRVAVVAKGALRAVGVVAPTAAAHHTEARS